MTPSHRPTLALCIPAFNAESELPRLLRSANAQNALFDEILVYDDASVDGTPAVAETFGARVIRGESNRGCSFGKNALAVAARSEWLHFHDADDHLYPHFVETALRWMTSAVRVDVVMIACEVRDEHGRRLGEHIFDDWALRVDPIRQTLLEQHVNSGIYRRDAFLRAGGFDLDPAVSYVEDNAMHCSLARAGLRFRADPTISSVIVQTPTSMSRANLSRCRLAHYHLLDKSAGVLSARHRDVITLKLWRMAAVCAADHDWDNADRCLRLARALGAWRSREGSLMFRFLSAFAPRFALRARETAIRLLRPHLRTNPVPA